MSRMHIALVTGVSVAASLLTPITASADESAAVCENPGYTVKEGTLNWGIKTSWRNYILNPSLTEGRWTTTDNVKDNDENRKGEDFQFIFPVDASATKLSVNKDGELQGAVVETEPSGVTFIGHPDKENRKEYALASTFISPYVHINGEKASAGTSYVGYYVPGKEMDQYKDADRVPANRVEGKDTFTDGKVKDFTVTPVAGSDDVTITFASQDMIITPQPGTDNHANINDGVDILFMGQYNADYKQDFDPFTVSLKATKTCLDADQAKSIKDEVTAETLPSEYATARGEDTKLPAEYISIFKNFYPKLELKKAETTPAPKPEPKPAPKPTTDPAKEEGLGAGAIAGIVIGVILAILGLLGAGAVAMNPKLLASFGM